MNRYMGLTTNKYGFLTSFSPQTDIFLLKPKASPFDFEEDFDIFQNS
jgi:hypothetical protein